MPASAKALAGFFMDRPILDFALAFFGLLKACLPVAAQAQQAGTKSSVSISAWLAVL